MSTPNAFDGAILALAKKVGGRIGPEVPDRDVLDAYRETDFVKRMLQWCDGQVLLLFAARWGSFGYPRFVVGARFAAALMSTSVSEEMMPGVRAPFGAFMVEVPDELLPTKAKDGARGSLTRVAVVRMRRPEDGEEVSRWAYVAFSGDMEFPVIYRFGVTTNLLVAREVPGAFVETLSEEMSSEDLRIAELVGRLIANLCLCVSDPEKVRERPRSKRDRGKGTGIPSWDLRRSARKEECRIFDVSAPTRHDLRPAVGAYLRGDRKALAACRAVRGHWKPTLAARIGRSVWVEPYLRGKEDAPLSPAAYVVSDGKG